MRSTLKYGEILIYIPKYTNKAAMQVFKSEARRFGRSKTPIRIYADKKKHAKEVATQWELALKQMFRGRIHAKPTILSESNYKTAKKELQTTLAARKWNKRIVVLTWALGTHNMNLRARMLVTYAGNKRRNTTQQLRLLATKAKIAGWSVDIELRDRMLAADALQNRN